MTQKEELQAKAKSLGIDPKDLTIAQLEAEIAIVEAKARTIATLEKAIEFGIDTENTAFEEVEKLVEAKETELAEKEAAKAKEQSKGYKTEDGKVYGFKPNTPKTLRVEDVTYTLEELVKNKEAMEFLIYGGSCFIKRLN